MQESPTILKARKVVAKALEHLAATTDATDNQIAQDTKSNGDPILRLRFFDEGSLNLGQITTQALPHVVHENRYKLFELARGVKALEKQNRREFSASELLAIFVQWYQKAKPFLRQGQSFDEYRFVLALPLCAFA